MENTKKTQDQTTLVDTGALNAETMPGETYVIENLIEVDSVADKIKAACLVLIAGGNGTRLFPISHLDCPKQFCPLNEDDTFAQDSIKRFIDAGFDPKRIIIVVTNDRQYELALKQTQGLGIIEPNILLIPPHHDYAGAMTVADDFIEEKFGDIVVVHTPADQFVVRGQAFNNSISELVVSAEQAPTLLGVYKSDLNTVMGCGNIAYKDGKGNIREIDTFIEKPEKDEAEKILREGNTVVNTGICAWKPSQLPKQYRHLQGALKTDELMDSFEKLNVVIGNFGWYDCGTLDSYWAISKKTPNHENASLHAKDGHVYRFGCLKSLFVTIDGVDLYAANIKHAAVVVNKVGEKLAICTVAKSSSQLVRNLAEDFQANKEVLEHHFVLNGTNNRVSRTNCIDEVYCGFVGVSDISVTVVKTVDGRYVVSVSRDAQ